VDYRHPLLEPIFKETYGYPVYQEQLMFAAVNLAGYTQSESDDLRKAIAKKIKDKLEKHRAKFVKGAVKNGIDEGTAQAIFADWEEFARYGFNKAHAADYGVIAVQTAYLKVHYPVEYMTALLSVSKNQIEKVALYAADCRRMGIAVQPPDVNCSGWDFTIEDEDCSGEDKGAKKAAIRFGMGAIKNVGAGPVEAILAARQQGSEFKDLNDFARRVDMRQVGKRALESLIKVGALDRYGPRPALLASLDRLLSVSATNFRAADQGQMSLFGAHTGIVDEIVLPRLGGEVSRREMLNWERELIGLYVSDHPLSPVMDMLTQAVTHFSAQLTEALPNERVRVAGLVTRVRPHQTKTGKAMGFVTLEDVQGNIELVVFPRTWEQYSELLDFDRVVLVDGKVDLAGAEPKVLVDSVTTEFKTLVPVPIDETRRNGAAAQQNASERSAPKPPANRAAPEARAVRESSPPADWDRSSVPPPPDAFPPDWEAFNEVVPGGFILEGNAPLAGITVTPTASAESTAQTVTTVLAASDAGAASEAAEPEELAERRSPVTPLDPLAPAEPAPAMPLLTVIQIAGAALAEANPPEAAAESPVVEPGYPLPHISPPGVESEDVRMVTVLLRPTGDKLRDNLRMRQAYGALISYPGSDRFAFLVHERGRSFQIEFPNFTTGINPELLGRLQRLVGGDNVRVEDLTIH